MFLKNVVLKLSNEVDNLKLMFENFSNNDNILDENILKDDLLKDESLKDESLNNESLKG